MGKATRELIKTSVYRLVGEGGFSSLSTQKIAEMSSMTKGNLYNYFPDKDTLVAEAYDDIERGLQEITEDFESNRELSDKENLKLLWERFYRYFTIFPEKAAFYVFFRNVPTFFDTVKDDNKAYSNLFVRKLSPHLDFDSRYKKTICEVLLYSTVKMAVIAVQTDRIEDDMDIIFETVFRGIC